MRRAGLLTLSLLLLGIPGCNPAAHDRRELSPQSEDQELAAEPALAEEIQTEVADMAEDREAPEIETDLVEGDPDATRILVKSLQAQLVALGFAPGYPDGALGVRTTIALSDFQRVRRLPVTGYADAATLAALFAATPEGPDGEIIPMRGVDAAPAPATMASGRPRLTRTRTFGFGAGIGFLAAAALAAVALMTRRRA